MKRKLSILCIAFSLGAFSVVSCAKKDNELSLSAVLENPTTQDIEPKIVAAAMVTDSYPKPIIIKKEPEKLPPPGIELETEIKEPEPVAVVEKEEPPKEEPVTPPAPPVAQKEPEPVVPAQPAPQDDEYTRSVGEVGAIVSKETFEEDKRTVLHIIDQLDTCMKNMDYKTWVTFLDPESVRYWSQKANLQKAASQLPVRGLKLNSLEDYFKYVFVGARKGRRVDEIRYETDSQVKAVQVNGTNDTVYYNFKKSNGVWKLHLPPL